MVTFLTQLFHTIFVPQQIKLTVTHFSALFHSRILLQFVIYLDAYHLLFLLVTKYMQIVEALSVCPSALTPPKLLNISR
jgi:hypothetical protein